MQRSGSDRKNRENHDGHNRVNKRMLFNTSGIPKWLWGTSFISVTIANMRETANTLAITPDTVAMIANITVSHKP